MDNLWHGLWVFLQIPLFTVCAMLAIAFYFFVFWGLGMLTIAYLHKIKKPPGVDK